MENELVVLPAEVAQIAENVSIEKRKEVQSVLNYVFNGVSKMREQLDSVVVANENDKTNMKLANTIRLGVRQVRLEAEKTFDAKRAEVQQQMLSYKTEDSLWLKAKQTMQILTKEIEENARWKEETRVRHEAEQKELRTQQRIKRVSEFNQEIQRSEFENMSDESFEVFLAGIKKAYDDKIAAEAEAERLANLYHTRKEELIPYWNFMKGDNVSIDFSAISQEDFDIILREVKRDKETYDKKQEEIRLENERLKVEAEEKEKQLEQERKKAKEQEIKAAVEKAKLEAELKAKKDAELKELKAKQEAEKKERNFPDKVKLLNLAKQISELAMPDVKNPDSVKIVAETTQMLQKVSSFIKSQAENM